MKHLNIDQLIAMTMEDGTLSVMSFCVQARGNVLPPGAAWLNDASGYWYRDPTDETVTQEIARVTDGGQACVRWRRITHADLPPEGRAYRYAWQDTGTVIGHDLTVAKQLHRHKIRKLRKAAFARLDAEWMKAVGQQNTERQALVEQARQHLRDAPNDPRIEAATSIRDLLNLPLPE